MQEYREAAAFSSERDFLFQEHWQSRTQSVSHLSVRNRTGEMVVINHLKWKLQFEIVGLEGDESHQCVTTCTEVCVHLETVFCCCTLSKVSASEYNRKPKHHK